MDGLPQEEDQDEGGVRVLRVWYESWEKRKVGHQGDSIFQARLVQKYGGLCLTDPDDRDTLRTARSDQMFFQKKNDVEEDFDSSKAWSGDTLTAPCMRFWCDRRGKLVHDYSLVGYMICPHPTIMAHCKNRGLTEEIQKVCY